MSKRFNPLSSAIAVATASVLLAVGGCAGTRSSDDTVALSADRTAEDLKSGTPQSSMGEGSGTMTAPTTVATAEPMDPSAPIQPSQQATVIAQGDTSATPMAPPQAPTTTTPAYTSSDSSMNSSTSMPSASTDTMNTTTSSTPAPLSSDTEPLPPRTDRN